MVSGAIYNPGSGQLRAFHWTEGADARQSPHSKFCSLGSTPSTILTINNPCHACCSSTGIVASPLDPTASAFPSFSRTPRFPWLSEDAPTSLRHQHTYSSISLLPQPRTPEPTPSFHIQVIHNSCWFTAYRSTNRQLISTQFNSNTETIEIRIRERRRKRNIYIFRWL